MVDIRNSLHIGDIKCLAGEAHRDATVRAGLFRAMQGDDSRMATNAAWALTHLPQSDNQYIVNERDSLVALALATALVSLRRLSLALLARIDWKIDDIRTDLLDFCLAGMTNSDQPYGVRSLCVKLAFLQCRHYPELTEELRQTLEQMTQTEMSAGLKHTWKKTLMAISTLQKKG